MGAYFEKVSRFADVDLPLPTRATKNSAGYDLTAAEDIIIPTLVDLRGQIYNQKYPYPKWSVGEVIEAYDDEDLAQKLEEMSRKDKDSYDPVTLDEMASLTKTTGAKPTLVSTGMKCHLEEGQYLEITVRSSTPLKYWLICANSEGIIDADYWNSAESEGEIFLQLINLSPFPIQIRRGDKIGQAIIKRYGLTSDDQASGIRTGGFGSTNG